MQVIELLDVPCVSHPCCQLSWSILRSLQYTSVTALPSIPHWLQSQPGVLGSTTDCAPLASSWLGWDPCDGTWACTQEGAWSSGLRKGSRADWDQPARVRQEGELQPALRTGEKRQQKKSAVSFSGICWGMVVWMGSGLRVGCSWIFGPAVVGGESL